MQTHKVTHTLKRARTDTYIVHMRSRVHVK